MRRLRPGVKRLCVALLGAVLFAACQPPADTARGAAERFLDRHYLQIDLHAARELCASVACKKLDAEIALTRDQTIEADTRKPRIEYELGLAKEDDVAAMFEYTLSISSDGYNPFEKKILLNLRRNGEDWQITNYSESDPAVRP